MKSLSIDEFCKSHDLSRSFFYALQARGEGPRIFKIGRCTRISERAATEWLAAREAAAVNTVAA